MNQILKYLFISIILFSSHSCNPVNPPDIPDTISDTSVWVLNSMYRIENYKTHKPSNKISLQLAKGEAEHFQVILETNERGTVSFEQTTPREGISVSVSEIKIFEDAEDPLVPVTSAITTKTKVIKLWITYETSVNAPVGEFSDVLTFKGTAGEFTVEVAMKIFNVTIPVTPTIPAVMGVNPPHVSSLQGEALLTKKKEFLDELLRRRTMPFYCAWHANKLPMAVECISSPYPWDDSRTLDYMADERYTHLLLPCHLVTTEQIGTFANQVKSRFPEKKQMYYVRDEPLVVGDYQLIKDKATEIHSVNPKGQVITTYFRGPTDPNNTNFNDFLSVWDHLEGYTDIYCAGVWAFQYKEERAELCRQKCDQNEEFWTYTAMGLRPGLTLANGTTPIDIHAVMWRVYKEKAKGYLYWVANAFSSLSPLRSRTDLPKGDGLLIYPGESFNSEKPVISMRLERFRDGCEEYELMALLEKKTSRENVLSILNSVYQGPAAHAGQVSSNPNEVINFKTKLLEELIK